jgi:hypothetical protein
MKLKTKHFHDVASEKNVELGAERERKKNISET